MGWTGLHRTKGMSNDDFFRTEFPETLTKRGEIVASATISSVYYAAVRDFATGEVWALIVLTKRIPNPHAWENFLYKEMSEDMGPCEANAPAKVLDALTETTAQYAIEWRAACRANLAAKASAVKVEPGTVIRMPRVLDFGTGRKVLFSDDTFRFVSRNRFVSVAHERTVSIPGWRTMAWTAA